LTLAIAGREAASPQRAHYFRPRAARIAILPFSRPLPVEFLLALKSFLSQNE
jgi:hypothetical protein